MIVSWNIRALNNVGKCREIDTRLKNLNLVIIILFETRVKMNKAALIRDEVGHKWSYFDNYDGHTNGRIWFLSDKSRIKVEKILSTDQFIHVGIYSLNGALQNWCTTIYAHNSLNLRRKLWKYLEAIHNGTQGPWFIIGDYTNVLSINDRVGGNAVKESEYLDLTSMMERVGMFEKHREGDHFTWSNRHIFGTIYSRINRVLGNLERQQENTDNILKIVDPSISEHCLLSLNQRNHPHQHRRCFKFPNIVTSTTGFLEAVETN